MPRTPSRPKQRGIGPVTSAVLNLDQAGVNASQVMRPALFAKKIIDLDFATDLFNGEHTHGIQKRIEEEQTSKKEIGA